MAVSGKNAQVKVSGTATAFTAEACTKVTANTVYQITSATKRAWGLTSTITVLKDAVSQASTLYTLNRLTGTITFLADIGAAPVVTVTGEYLPLSVAAEAKEYSYTITQEVSPDTAFGDSYDTNVTGIKSVSGSLSQWWTTDTYFRDALVAAAPVMIEFWSDSTGSYDMRCWALLNADEVQSALRGNVEESVSFVGTTDSDLRSISG